ncbi:LacI family DNA-binding transcriptional regulator [Sphingobium sufflavum]|uniref:LacI family DNA-binding transcriptional regulator n=1 Tax=Sphingobium sufflavum TaxID=1129547 RepID=UPI001F2A8C77|nr:LacI family DNA-binding transcriptional regulator [Sphingobium sufflavum]MCE7794951.1 LacI family DNA-binding transcriptional regulator [Sphingobium sufflavum]
MDRSLKRIRPSPPSAHDVARLAGVSQAAVSRAFTPGASIAKATREKVMEAATELGYRPNLLARSLIKGVSDLIGVVIGNTQNPFFLPVLEELSTRLTRAGKHSLVFTAEHGHDADFQIEDVLRYRVDALVLMSASLSFELAEKCSREGIPLIFFNRRPRWDLPMASVTGANEKGAGEIGRHLLEQGYRRIAYMGGPTDSPTNNEREEGFRRALEQQGAEPAMRELGYLTREGGMAAARALLNRPDRPDAIFCANDFMAIAAMEVARHEFGLEIGREIGIAGFDDMPDASWPSFDLTTYSQPIGPMIDRVMELVLDLDARERFEQVIVEGALQKRGSTRRG